jgi:hypothetical protein
MELHKAWVVVVGPVGGSGCRPSMDSDGGVAAAALELTTGQISERRQVERRRAAMTSNTEV